MDIQEAIIELEKMYPKTCKMVNGRLNGGFNDYESPGGIAIQMAIKALQEQVSYACQHPQESAMPNNDEKDIEKPRLTKIDRPEITKMLSEHLEKQINAHDVRVYWAKEVTFDYGTTHAERVDYMRFVPKNNSVSGIEKGDFYCYEIKSSVEDFQSKNGHNFLGDYNYYVMTKDVYDIVKDEIPYHIGVYIPYGHGLKSIKTAKRKDRDRAVEEMLLMMFRSAARDRR